MIIGTAMAVCVTGSADGVSIAAMMKIIRIAYFVFLIRNFGVTRPRRAKKNIRVGSWKTIPMARSILT